MSNTRVTQAHKVAIAAGGQVPARVTQAHKIVLLTVGSVPSRVIQAHKVVLVQVSVQPPAGAIYFGPTLIAQVRKGTDPVSRVYAGSSLTHLAP